MDKMEISKDIKTANTQLFEICQRAIEEENIAVQATFIFTIIDARDGKTKIMTHVLDEHEEFAHKEEVAKIFALRLAAAKKEGIILSVEHVTMLSEAYMSTIKKSEIKGKDISTAYENIHKQFSDGERLRPSKDPNSVDVLIVASMDKNEKVIISTREIEAQIRNDGEIIRKLSTTKKDSNNELTNINSKEDVRATALEEFWDTYKKMTA